MYRVLDDHRRSILYKPQPQNKAKGGGEASSVASNANNRYDVVDAEYDEDEAFDISFVPQQDDLLCDDVLPFGWYRFLTYGM